MYKGKRISMSIPCLNEEKLIGKTLAAVPDFVDKIFVVDDGSTDETSQVVEELAKADERIELLRNDQNMGNGYSVVRGFRESIRGDYDINCIVAGDNQCRQEYLADLVEEVASDACDYAKANRFSSTRDLNMPPFRKFGNIVMSFVNKFATGYYSIFDPLNSYSATKVSTLKRLDLDSISHRYDFENSYLFHLYLAGARVKDVAVPARYEDEVSTIKLRSYIPATSKTLLTCTVKRFFYKYFLLSLHPIALFLVSGFLFFGFGLVYGLYIFVQSLNVGHTPATTATVMLSVVPFIVGFQLLLYALVLDIQNEPKSR
jgi:glycosyltransferase involved in cell wall biosynthesis